MAGLADTYLQQMMRRNLVYLIFDEGIGDLTWSLSFSLFFNHKNMQQIHKIQGNKKHKIINNKIIKRRGRWDDGHPMSTPLDDDQPLLTHGEHPSRRCKYEAYASESTLWSMVLENRGERWGITRVNNTK